ncbi:phosphoprotein [Dissostichus eleginoides]|uniref:Phosphoprotein n=1 Tax=Dissostichus eleginoides TaxID=100907 RepID=A0AAD9BMY7_DISEL|nr:phosphoprotein [Dissostichus eleginoides]
MDVELAASCGEKRNLEETSESLPLTPSKGAHARKMIEQNPTAADVLAAIQALHVRFDNQEQKMAEFDTKMTQNAVMIANITKSIEFNAEGVK